MDVSVIIPVLNEERHLHNVFAGLCTQSYAGPMEFLFVDGGSTDRSSELIADFARQDDRVRLLQNPHGITPQALNIGLHAASGRVVVRMDAHARYKSDYIATGVERLARGDVVSVGGPQLAVGYDKWSRRAALALRSPLGVGGAGFRRGAAEEFEVDSGFTGLWLRSVLLAIGGWDGEWIGDEDLELAARLRKAGGRIVCLPEMAADYAPRNSLSALARQYWSYGRARVRTSRRHPESLRPSQLLPPALAVTAGVAAGPRQPFRAPARLGALVYILALLVEGARTRGEGASPSDAAAAAAVLATMHWAYAAGMAAGLARYGVPVAALSHVARTLTRRAPMRTAEA